MEDYRRTLHHCLCPQFQEELGTEFNRCVKVTWVPALGIFMALSLGFTVADVSNVRWLGGLLLVAIGGIAVGYMFVLGGPLRAALTVLILGISFALSHPLGAVLGSYGSLLLVSAAAGLIVYFLTPSLTQRSART